MFMNCAGPEGPFNTIGRVCFLGNMLPGPVPKSGKIPKSCFSCISDLVSQLEDAVGPIDELVEKGKLLYSLAQTDWSDPSSVLGAIGGVAGIAGLQDVAGLAQDAKDLYDTGKKVMNTDWSDPKQALAAVAGISNVLGMEDIAQVAGMADKIRDTINTDWSDPKAAIKAAKNIMSATGLDDMADEFIRDLLAPSAGDDANADLPDCFPRPGKSSAASSSAAASTATPPVCDPAKIPVSKDGKPRQCITQDVADAMKLTNPLAHERYQMMTPEEQAEAFVEYEKEGSGTGAGRDAKGMAIYLPGKGFSTTANERENADLPETPRLREWFRAEEDGEFLGIKEQKGNWYLFWGAVDLGSPEMPGAGTVNSWWVPDKFFGLDMSGYYDYHDKYYYGSDVTLGDMDSILSHEIMAAGAGVLSNPLTLPLQAIYSTATTLAGTYTAAKNSLFSAIDNVSNLEFPGHGMFDSLSDMYGKLFGETSAATPADVLDPTAGGGCFGGGAASSAGAGGAGGAPGNPAPPGAPAKPPGTAPSGSPASGAGRDGILITTVQGNPAAAAAAIEASFRAANAKALADAEAKEKAAKEKAAKEKGPLTSDQAKAAFDQMASQSDIAFKYPRDGCYARAHIMAARLKEMGIEPSKVWTFAPPGEELSVLTPNVPEGHVEWGYHVAPTIPVQNPDGTIQDMVIDPSMFDEPVTIDEWAHAQHSDPIIIRTPLGVPPIPTSGGSGYWPSRDPPEGTDQHAEETMEDYKHREGT